ncbi:MAG: YhjD/YihY/BrkB family envelope integrity protein [Candidatus Limnocylindrales bacterium]
MPNQLSQAPTPPEQDQSPEAPRRTVPAPPATAEAGATKPASALERLRARAEGIAQRITGSRYVKPVLDVVAVANDTGAPIFAAALAFGTLFAFIPLVLLISGVSGWLVDDPVQRAQLLNQLVSYVPPLADFFRASLEGVVTGRGALSIVGVIGLLWGASAFYGVLDEVMCRIFSGGGPRNEISRRIRGFATIAILLLVILGTISLGGVWALLGDLVGGAFVLSYAAPLMTLAVMILLTLAAYLFVPTAPPSLRAALWPAVAAGIAIGILTNLFSLLAPLLIGGLSGFGIVATVFGALVWLNFSYQILLYGAAWARVRRDRAVERAATA